VLQWSGKPFKTLRVFAQLRKENISCVISLSPSVRPSTCSNSAHSVWTFMKSCTRYKSYCSTVHFRRITSIYQPPNAHIISHKHFKTLRHVSILSDYHQGALFLAKVILQYSQFNSYLQTRCCGSTSCCVGMCCGAVARCASHAMHT